MVREGAEPAMEYLDAPGWFVWDGWSTINRLRSANEVSCIDKSSKQGQSFYRVFQVLCFRGRALVDISYMPDPESPSKLLKDNPEHANYGLTSVYRTAVQTTAHRSNELESGTAFTVTGPINSEHEFLLLTCNHCVPFKDESEVRVSNIQNGVCVTSSSVVHHGDKFRVHARLESEDLACLRSKASDGSQGSSWQTCFLPTTSIDLKRGTPICTYSYPAVQIFLQRAYNELVLGVENYGIWDSYGNLHDGLFQQCGSMRCAKGELHELLKDTWGRIGKGGLVASPGIIRDAVNKTEVLNSALPGSSGGPVTTFQGAEFEFIGMHQFGRRCTNYALNCDNIDFVKFYAANVLPHLPSLTSPTWGSRDLTGFQQWLTHHNLKVPED